LGPNSLTVAVATHSQLEEFVLCAKHYRTVIIYDAAYANFIRKSGLPYTIYEINDAKVCVIEINSFSKIAGFTHEHLDCTIVPKTLIFED